MGTFDDPKSRLLARSAREGECIVWTGAGNPNGYGLIVVAHKNIRKLVHRLSYEINFGEIPNEMCVCHACDNRRCFNPDHLFLGTSTENNLDRVNKNRSHRPVGELSGRAKLNWASVFELRALYDQGGFTHRELAARYGVSGATILDVLHNRKWVV